MRRLAPRRTASSGISSSVIYERRCERSSKFANFPMPDGVALAYERLARQMGLSGGKSPAILVLAGSNVLLAPRTRPSHWLPSV